MLTASDLPTTLDGRVYHLNLRRDQLAQSVILVGDPDRVPVIAEAHLRSIDADVFHRGLRTMSGRTETGLGLTITTSGMGTPSLEIVLQELAVLNEVDFKLRAPKSEFAPLRLVRVGTSGALQSRTALGTCILTEYAVGLDNTGLFYDVPHADEMCVTLEELVSDCLERCWNGTRFKPAQPYSSRANPGLLSALEAAASELGTLTVRGVTVSNSGFFANQGRDISRVVPSAGDIDRALSKIRIPSSALHFENMEMEASFLLHFAHGLGYPAAAVCPAVANREEDTFAEDFQSAVANAAALAVRALELFDRSSD